MCRVGNRCRLVLKVIELMVITLKVFVDLILKVLVTLFCGALFRVVRMISSGSDRRAVIVAPPGGGNIGDEALVQITLDKYSSYEKSVFVNAVDSFQQETVAGERLLVAPKLVYGNGLAFVRTLFEFKSQFIQASHIAIIGADVMDGAYNERASFTRIWLSIFGRLLGCNVRVLGFSLNSAPKPSCKVSLKVAQALGVNLFLRDPISHERALGVGISQAIACADVVFCDRRKERYDLPSKITSSGYVIVNVSGLIFKEEHSVADLASIVGHIVAKGFKVVLLPHVSRPGADDIPVCDKLYENLSEYHGSIEYIRKLLKPKQIRSLCEGSLFVITGRMHLGVMALSQCKCAFIFSSQGKVEGLLKMFGLPQLEIDSAKVYGDRVMNLVDDVFAGKLIVSEEELNKVIQRAELNFSDLLT